MQHRKTPNKEHEENGNYNFKVKKTYRIAERDVAPRKIERGWQPGGALAATRQFGEKISASKRDRLREEILGFSCFLQASELASSSLTLLGPRFCCEKAPLTLFISLLRDYGACNGRMSGLIPKYIRFHLQLWRVYKIFFSNDKPKMLEAAEAIRASASQCILVVNENFLMIDKKFSRD